jgi:hypothetical protein
MAFTDPIDFDPGSGAVELFRVISGFNTSSYSNPDGTILLKAEHNYARRTRRVFRVDTNKITADPFIPSQNAKVSASMYLVADLPVAGYDVSELVDLYTGLNTCLTDPGFDRLEAWLGGQS